MRGMKVRMVVVALAALALLGTDDCEEVPETVLVNGYALEDGSWDCPPEECSWKTGYCCEIAVPEDWQQWMPH